MSGAGNEFYGVAAQVLPVLFVVLSVEFEGGYIPDSLTEVEGADGLDLSGPQLSPEAKRVRIEVVTEAVYTTVMLAIFCFGEILALAAYEAKFDTTVTRLGVWVVLGCGAAACVFPLLSEQYRGVYDRTRPQTGYAGLRSRPLLLKIEGILLAVAVTAVLTAIGVLILSS
jgi:hypothetical protein